ncbi:hypothetical protein BP6252_12780 [Coleophoma cylindrospora]|uniref:Uncharacterized protein n=1 Tax=Coleophoma cylindrospora TaxID=1849047 RepID=A0A3D8QCW9_9HELO|nr:hypothetical protein BP6252_12780 [Coleophoma cylindrospora]
MAQSPTDIQSLKVLQTSTSTSTSISSSFHKMPVSKNTRLGRSRRGPGNRTPLYYLATPLRVPRANRLYQRLPSPAVTDDDEDDDISEMSVDLGPPAMGVWGNPSHVEDRTGGWVNYWSAEEYGEVVQTREERTRERRRRERRRSDAGVGGVKARRAWRKGMGKARARGPDGRFV